MAITGDSKQTLRQEKSKLEESRAIVQKRIDELDVQRTKLVSRKQELTTAINNLKKDIDNG